MRRRERERIITGRVNADGTIAAGTGFTVTKGATGFYTLRFPGLNGVPQGIVVQSLIGAPAVFATDTFGPGTVRVDGQSADRAFSFATRVAA